MCIHLILGPMFSGKTSELLRLGKRFRLAGRRVVYVKHTWESFRFPLRNNNNNNTLSLNTHNGNNSEGDMENKGNTVLVANLLMDVFWHLSGPWPDTICIDDGQFFADLRPACEALASIHGKHIIIAALNANIVAEMFAPVVAILPLATEVQWLTAVCFECGGNKAAFTAIAYQNNIHRHHHRRHYPCRKQQQQQQQQETGESTSYAFTRQVCLTKNTPTPIFYLSTFIHPL